VSARRTLLAVLPLLAVAIAFWVLLLGPKREEASKLESDVTALQAEVDEQEQLAAKAEAARKEFPRAYRRVVVLGKAAPEDDDTSSLLVQLNRIAESSGVEFVSLEAEEGVQAAPTSAPATPQTPADTAEESEQEAENAGEAEAAPAPPTEASAASLPIGASIGPAGLPVMKYSLSFQGGFFELADFLAGLDAMVRTKSDGVRVRGRLMTVDGFDLSPLDIVDSSASDPKLGANVTVTTYLTPEEEGVTAGASPTGPAPATEPQPASTSTSPTPSTTTASTSAP
jgi:outer membrane murein-binding lipoprotein Lpp